MGVVLQQIGIASPVHDRAVKGHCWPGFGLQQGITHSDAYPDPAIRTPAAKLHQLAVFTVF